MKKKLETTLKRPAIALIGSLAIEVEHTVGLQVSVINILFIMVHWLKFEGQVRPNIEFQMRCWVTHIWKYFDDRSTKYVCEKLQ